jgi:hypothetical protein
MFESETPPQEGDEPQTGGEEEGGSEEGSEEGAESGGEQVAS